MKESRFFVLVAWICMAIFWSTEGWVAVAHFGIAILNIVFAIQAMGEENEQENQEGP